MKKLHLSGIAVMILYFSALTSAAQTPEWIWAKSAESDGIDDGISVVTDAQGNVLVTGSFGGTSIDFSGTVLNNAGCVDMFTAKYSPQGDLIWARRAGGGGSDTGYEVATDASGNVIVTGEFASTSITFGSITLVRKGYYDFFIVKYDSAGNALWAKSGGSDMNASGHAVATDADGNIYATGYYDGDSVTFDNHTLINTGGSSGSDIFLVKYDENGNLRWIKNFGGDYWDFSYDIACDHNAGIHITGDFCGTFCSFDSIMLIQTGVYDLFLTNIDSSGHVVRASAFGGFGYDYGTAICTDPSDHLYLAGSFDSQDLVIDTITLHNQTGFGETDGFIAKFNPAGDVIWAKSYGGKLSDYSTGVSCDASGDVFFCGYFKSDSIHLGAFTLNNLDSAYYDFFIAETDPDGNVILAEANGTMYNDFCHDITVDPLGHVIITGGFCIPEISFDTIVLTNTGIRNVFTAKSQTPTTSIINAKSHIGDVRVFPNPASDNINLILPDHAIFLFFNERGQPVRIPDNACQNSNIDIRGLPAGIYIIRVTSPGINLSVRFIKI